MLDRLADDRHQLRKLRSQSPGLLSHRHAANHAVFNFYPEITGGRPHILQSNLSPSSKHHP